MSDKKKFLYILAAFLAFYLLPADAPRVQGASASASCSPRPITAP